MPKKKSLWKNEKWQIYQILDAKSESHQALQETLDYLSERWLLHKLEVCLRMKEKVFIISELWDKK